MTVSPWLNAREAGAYIKRSPRYVSREANAGRLRAARIGGRGELLTRREWLDQHVEENARPVVVPVRRRA